MVLSDSNEGMIALAIHDGVYLLDFCVDHVGWNDERHASNSIADFIISKLSKYQHEHLCKILGAGVPQKVTSMSPTLCSRLWAELDVLPVSPHDYSIEGLKAEHDQISWDNRSVEEQADSMARKCIMPVPPIQDCPSDPRTNPLAGTLVLTRRHCCKSIFEGKSWSTPEIMSTWPRLTISERRSVLAHGTQ